MKTARSIVVLGIVSGCTILTIGCSSEGDVVMDEGNLTSPNTVEGQRDLCDARIRENGAARDADVDVGVVRWKCGDVKGITGKELGQEYCEFHAVQEGTVVDSAAKSKVKAAKVECLFTGVYRDVKGEAGGAGNEKFGADLNKALTEEEGNLKEAKGKALPKLGVNPFSVMNGRFNGRGAATALLRDCQNSISDNEAADRINAAPDDKECDASGANCASKRDIEACTMIIGNGEGWRNSDPTICGRAARGALCGATYDALPTNLDGFLMTDWNADLGQAVKLWTGQSDEAPSAPDGCRYATVNGKPYLHMMICTPTSAQVTNPKYEGQLQQMCSDVFGPKIAMTAPIGLVAKGVKADAEFCGKFDKGNATLKTVAAGAKK